MFCGPNSLARLCESDRRANLLAENTLVILFPRSAEVALVKIKVPRLPSSFNLLPQYVQLGHAIPNRVNSLLILERQDRLPGKGKGANGRVRALVHVLGRDVEERLPHSVAGVPYCHSDGSTGPRSTDLGKGGMESLVIISRNGEALGLS